MPRSDHLDERLTLGFRMLNDEFGTRDGDEIPQDIEDVEGGDERPGND